ncbi:NAD(P)-binding protein [Cyathus striatus]|nr:NAD(P)-binding protein [Cyathus striatus]
MSSPKVWLVTGSSSGLGLAVVEHALSKGDNIVATLRTPDVLSHLSSKYPQQLFVVKLDVTKQEEIVSAFRAAQDKFGRVDVVYNNAGFSAISEIEGTPDELARNIFEVNFWGAANVSREAVRFFRDENKPSGGRLLQASSLAAMVGSPLIGYYTATKFALEGFSETLTTEIDPDWNVKVTILTLEGFKTSAILPEKMINLPTHPKYQKIGDSTRAYAQEIFKTFGDSNKAAREIYKIACHENRHCVFFLARILSQVRKLKQVLLLIKLRNLFRGRWI